MQVFHFLLLAALVICQDGHPCRRERLGRQERALALPTIDRQARAAR